MPQNNPCVLKIVWCIALCFYFLTSFSQDRKEQFSFSRLDKKVIGLPSSNGSIYTGNFDRVIVKDARLDTNAVLLTKSSCYSIPGFTGGAAKYFNDAFGTDAGNNAGKQLVIFIKKFWFASQYQTEDADEEGNDLKQSKWTGALLFKADCYFRSDSFYYPLFRYDTTLVMSSQNVVGAAALTIDSCFSFLAQKVVRFQNRKVTTQSKKLTLAEVEQYNNNRIALPIFTDAALKKGVYVTFDEFKNNTPKYAEYSVEKGKLTDGLYIKDSAGNETLARNIWGYCDGKDIYYKSADNYFLLTRIGNSFYLKGVKSIKSSKYIKASSVLTDGFIVGALRPHNTKIKFSVDPVPFQLDMDAGEIY